MRHARPRLWQPIPNFPDLAALNAWLERRCLELWREIPHGRLAGSLADVWAEEQPVLMPLPPAFDGFVEQSQLDCGQHRLLVMLQDQGEDIDHLPISAGSSPPIQP